MYTPLHVVVLNASQPSMATPNYSRQRSYYARGACKASYINLQMGDVLIGLGIHLQPCSLRVTTILASVSSLG
jgi:hypothetical protein